MISGITWITGFQGMDTWSAPFMVVPISWYPGYHGMVYPIKWYNALMHSCMYTPLHPYTLHAPYGWYVV